MDNYDLLFTNSPSNSETAIKLKHVRKLANCKCVVCGDKPTGYHYSVLSCNGCKTFFRRTIISNRVFLCRRGGECKIGTDFRCMCRACRFDKCIQVGMNREMIQYPSASECGVDMKMPLTRLVFDHTRSPTIEELIVVLLGRESSTYHCRRKDLPVEPDFPLKEVIKRPSILDEQASLFPLSHLPWFLVDTVLVVEYAKTFRMFQKLSEAEQCALLSSTGIHVLLFSQSFYSQKQNSRWLVFPDGHCVGVLSRFIKSHQRIEELYARPVECVRELQLSNREFAMLKAILLVTPEIARNRETHELISEVRRRLTFGLHKLIMHEFGDKGAARFGALLSAAASFIRFAEDRREAVQVAYTLNWLQLPPLVRDIYIKYEQDEQPIPIPNNT